MTADAIDHITNDQKRADARVEKRLNAKMIARAKQLFVTRVPKREGKIALQAIDASCAPCCICLQNQITVRRVRAHVPVLKLQRSEEHTSELQSLTNLVCRLLLEKKKTK